MLGIRWHHRLQLWVVYEKSTDKILKKCATEKEAKRAIANLRILTPKRRKY